VPVGSYAIRIKLTCCNKIMANEIKTDIRIKLLPRSSRSQIMGMEGEFYKVKVNSPPVDGEANKELISLISKRLRMPKSSIEIISGKTSKMKVLRVSGIDGESVSRLMQAE
jgi:uncharacterized protein (TIGR00251 family)